MELIIDVLILFVVLSCAVKVSMWHWWWQVVLGVTTWLMTGWAVEQSKTQIADLMTNETALQTLAIMVTLDAAVVLVYCLRRLNEDKHSGVWSRLWDALLEPYPVVLIVPSLFYLLTQAIFAATGVSFATTGLLFAAAVAILLPLLAQGIKRLLPEQDLRIEVLLLLVVFVCVIGLLITQHGRIIYAAKAQQTDWLQLAGVLALMLAVTAAGVLLHKWKWRKKKTR